MEATKELLGMFLRWAIDEHDRINGDYNGYAGVAFECDTYESISEEFILEIKTREEIKNLVKK